MKKTSKISLVQVVRHLFQLAAFLLWPGLFISVFHAIPNIIQAVAAGTFSMATEGLDVFLLVAVLPLTIFFGRQFCGWICSFGAMQDLLWGIRRLFTKGRKTSVHIPAPVELVLTLVKYSVLILLAAFVWTGIWKMSADLSPWTIFGLLAAGNFGQAAALLLTPGMLLFVLILVGSLFIERFFCRFLCPLGALFSLISLGRFFRIHRNPNRCTGCTLCDRQCPMGISVSSSNNKVKSGQCIDCMKCTEVCPASALRADPGSAVGSAAASAAVFGLVACGHLAASSNLFQPSTSSGASAYVSSESDISDALSNASVTVGNADTSASSDSDANTSSSDTADSAGSTGSDQAVSGADSETSSNVSSETGSQAQTGFTDGTYTGSGQGLRGEVSVQVTVSGGQITDIEVLSYQDDDEFFSRAKSGVISEVLSQQSVQVDTVSGATYSSNGILSAVADALNLDYTPATPSSGHGDRH